MATWKGDRNERMVEIKWRFTTCSSWAAFAAALVILLAGNLLAGEIRPTGWRR